MNRSAFIAALLGAVGIGKAQQWKRCGLEETEFATGRQVRCDEPFPAKNNQCPVCGTMAEPYRRDGDGNVISGWVGSIALSINLTRCKRCNAAFWQDAS
jgi:hypothetical protein